MGRARQQRAAVPTQGFFTNEDMPLVNKISLYVEDNWNKCDMVAIFLFVAGVTCRWVAPAPAAACGPGRGTRAP